ncbi:piggyBac transposable element-derived protein 4-like [Vespula squamosa]|uniref:PiggyBac transposable element-derived protein 4-like n=1 Tax=Vespula squamosa TaxID=30214 RepID=A0ABD2A1L9_VESSQ
MYVISSLHVWSRFNENSQISYDMNMTVDEQLFPAKMRCKFTQYIPKEETRLSSIPLGKFVVLKLIKPFTLCWRHVTMDNFLTSTLLATKLLIAQAGEISKRRIGTFLNNTL